jgi:hypothetical protein
VIAGTRERRTRGSLTPDARVSDAGYAAVAGFLGEPALVELTMLIGLYRLVACFANALDVDLDDRPAQRLREFRGDGA